jgi:hypothetical protein
MNTQSNSSMDIATTTTRTAIRQTSWKEANTDIPRSTRARHADARTIKFGVPGGILKVHEGASRYRTDFTVMILVGDKTYNVDESADLTITAAQSAALVIARLDRRRKELLGDDG